MAEKLIRDKIQPVNGFKEVQGPAYKKALADKLKEESFELIKELKQKEVSKENAIAEISDVLEVLSCIVQHLDLDTDILFDFANKKREESGSFLKGIVVPIKYEK